MSENDQHDEEENRRKSAFTAPVPYLDDPDAMRDEILRERVAKGDVEAAKELFGGGDRDPESFDEYAEEFVGSFPDAPDWAVYLGARLDEHGAELEELKAMAEASAGEKESSFTL
ncbi:hypothetical protein [Natronorarus salvus]|uniref:hypothetical protein n=1 Tax=Natronorarus salvus TaxID=3117733 RepID=UPI002F26B4AB